MDTFLRVPWPLAYLDAFVPSYDWAEDRRDLPARVAAVPQQQAAVLMAVARSLYSEPEAALFDAWYSRMCGDYKGDYLRCAITLRECYRQQFDELPRDILNEFAPWRHSWDTLPTELRFLGPLAEQCRLLRYTFDEYDIRRKIGKKVRILQEALKPLSNESVRAALRDWAQRWHCERWDDVQAVMQVVRLGTALGGAPILLDPEPVSNSYADYFARLEPSVFGIGAPAANATAAARLADWKEAIIRLGPAESFRLSCWERVCWSGASRWSEVVIESARLCRLTRIRSFVEQFDHLVPTGGPSAVWRDRDADLLNCEAVLKFARESGTMPPGLFWSERYPEHIAELLERSAVPAGDEIEDILCGFLISIPIFDSEAARRVCGIWRDVAAATKSDRVLRWTCSRLVWTLARVASSPVKDWCARVQSMNFAHARETRLVLARLSELLSGGVEYVV